jgi:hypothetical protein
MPLKGHGGQSQKSRRYEGALLGQFDVGRVQLDQDSFTAELERHLTNRTGAGKRIKDRVAKLRAGQDAELWDLLGKGGEMGLGVSAKLVLIVFPVAIGVFEEAFAPDHSVELG